MEGPEKRFYELTETGTGRLQAAMAANLLIVAGCIVITALFTLNMIPVSRLRLVIFSQVLAMLLSGLLGSHLMIDSIADLLKGRFSLNTLLTVTFVACVADSLLCLRLYLEARRASLRSNRALSVQVRLPVREGTRCSD